MSSLFCKCLQLCLHFSLKIKLVFLTHVEKVLLSYILSKLDVLQMLELNIAKFCWKRIYSISSKHILLSSYILPSFLQSFKLYLRVSVKPWKNNLVRLFHHKLQWEFFVLLFVFCLFQNLHKHKATVRVSYKCGNLKLHKYNFFWVHKIQTEQKCLPLKF